MRDSNRLGGYFNASGHNTVLAWLFVAVLGGSVVGGVAAGRPESVLFGVAAVVVVTTPAVRFRDPAAVPPWYFVGLICLPVSWDVFAPVSLATPIPVATAVVPSLAVATLGLLITVDLDRFTSLRLVPWFAVVFTVLLTLAMSGLLNVLRWSSDVLFGTTHLLDGRSQDTLVLSLTYLTLSLRDEIYALRDRLPNHLSPIYGMILLGYDPAEREKIRQILWWLAVAILALVPLLSGGVVPWLFGLISAQPGWFGAAAGPSMLVESLTSAIAFVIVVIAAFRSAYGWEEIINDAIFRDLGKLLAFLTLATIWFFIHDVLTGIYLAPAHVADLTDSILALPYFWGAVAGLVVPFVYVSIQLVWPDKFFNVSGLVLASLLVSITILNKKVMFIVEGLMHPSSPPLSNLYPTGTYFPNWVEWSLVIGTLLVVGLGFVIVSKVIPMVELGTVSETDTESEVEA